MKYRLSLPGFILLVVASVHFAGAQGRGNVSWRDASFGPVSKLIISFGKAADLNYMPEDSVDLGLFERRQNKEGMEMFLRSMVLPKEAADSSLYRADLIINFADTAYIRLFNEIEACTDYRLKDSLKARLTANSKVYKMISIDEYIRGLKKMYLRDDIKEDFLPGIASGVETSAMRDEDKAKQIFIAEKRQRMTSTRWLTYASANFDFVGYYLDRENQPQHAELRNAKLVFEISFDEIKASNGKRVYSNYRIEKVTQPLDTTLNPWSIYLFSVEPFVSGGLRNITSSTAIARMKDKLDINSAFSMEGGVLFGRKMKPFSNKPFVEFSVASGITLSRFVVSSTIADGYDEDTPKESPPFEKSSFLSAYSLYSVFNDVEFQDVQMFIGVPLQVGLGFKLDANNKIRGFINTALTWNFPLSSGTTVDGTVDQTGKFTYKVVLNGKEEISEVSIGGEGNPLSEYFGLNQAKSTEEISWKNGWVSKTEIGVSFDMKNNTWLKLAPYFSVGSCQLKNPAVSFLALEGGDVRSPLSSMDNKLFFNSYGISLSVMFDVIRLTAK